MSFWQKVGLSAATFAIDKPYDYLLPDELRETAAPGMRVLVPFGTGNRRIEGIILALSQGQPNPRLKAVIALLDDTPVLDSESIQLALWMRERVFLYSVRGGPCHASSGTVFLSPGPVSLAKGVDKEAATRPPAGPSMHVGFWIWSMPAAVPPKWVRFVQRLALRTPIRPLNC